MSEYSPCPSCRRHVKDALCPFCGAGTTRREPIATLGTMSRAMVFASATLAAAACGGSQKPKADNNEEGRNSLEEYEERNNQNHPCRVNEYRVNEAQKKVDAAKTPEEKQAAENELAEARQPVCAPYGAPPARRRVV